MSLDRDLTVAFTGNRVLVAPLGLFEDDLEEVVRTSLRDELLRLYDSGKRRFISGAAIGFDLLAAEEVVALRAERADVQLVLALPFVGQEAKYSEGDKARYRDVVAVADEVIVIEPCFSLKSYHLRNQYMIDNCSALIAYSCGKGRGTLSTIRRAAKSHVEVINIYEILGGNTPATQLSLKF